MNILKRLNDMIKLTQEEFIKKSQKSHNSVYDYSMTNYVNNRCDYNL